MARTATKTANILSTLYDEQFSNDCMEPFRITWPQLRSIAGVPRLTETDLKDIGIALYYHDRHLIQFDNFLLVAAERDFVQIRTVPDRLIEQNMPDGNLDIEEDEMEDEDEEVANEDIEV